MAIRLRRVEGVGLVALCAARSIEKPGDLYLDDGVHYALSQKFTRDFADMEGGYLPGKGLKDCLDQQAATAAETEESNNPNREWWDRTYGPDATR